MNLRPSHIAAMTWINTKATYSPRTKITPLVVGFSMVAELEAAGLITVSNGRILPTVAGREVGRDSRAYHDECVGVARCIAR